tara:strand:+ start:990 stop:1310 length:321 start_codon:yes stop_codon:yes gene_type:complete
VKINIDWKGIDKEALAGGVGAGIGASAGTVATYMLFPKVVGYVLVYGVPVALGYFTGRYVYKHIASRDKTAREDLKKEWKEWMESAREQVREARAGGSIDDVPAFE